MASAPIPSLSKPSKCFCNNAMASARALSLFKPSKWWCKTVSLGLILSRFRPKTVSKRSLVSSPSFRTHKRNTKVDDFRMVFSHVDSDGDGKISTEELRTFFVSLGEPVSQKVAQELIGDFDTDGDGALGEEDFVKLLECDKNPGEHSSDSELCMAFEMFQDEKGCGYISPNGLQRMLSHLGDAKTEEECASMIRKFDLDGNGVIDFQEFVRMMS